MRVEALLTQWTSTTWEQRRQYGTAPRRGQTDAAARLGGAPYGLSGPIRDSVSSSADLPMSRRKILLGQSIAVAAP